MKTLLIGHAGASLTMEGVRRWLASFTDLVGVVSIRETPIQSRRRLRREIRRVGWMRFLDVVAFRLYYRVFLASADRRWERDKLRQLTALYPEPDEPAPVHVTHSPNAPETRKFITEAAPDLILARCKIILKEEIFGIPSKGTFIMHPGICPEYRNIHGCFWALSKDDVQNVGMTLLRIDAGVDTGPVYGYYTCGFDQVKESHIRIQHRVALENLVAVQEKLGEIDAGVAVPLDTRGRSSRAWGQPWLTKHLSWKLRARRAL